MRIYVVNSGHKTTISVEDQLIGYLQKWLVKHHAGKRYSPIKERLWIQLMVDAASDMLPTKGLSQWVQARIIDAIADPALKDESKREEEAELALRIKKLTDLRREEWDQMEAARNKLVKDKEVYEILVKKLAKKIPPYRRPPRSL